MKEAVAFRCWVPYFDIAQALPRFAEPEVITKNLSENKLYFTSAFAKL